MRGKKGKNYRAQCAMITTLLIFAAYLVYRSLYHINWDTPLFSLIFLYAEFHSFISLACFYFQIWNPIKRQAPPAPTTPGKVDVFITTYNEDIGLLRNTVLACINMRVPHRTVILDDGQRPEVRKLSEELGCHYLARGHNRDAKAGNLNYGLEHSEADFVAVFDADHVPKPEFLERTLGYFTESSDVGLVQTPQHYYNTDSLSFSVDHKREEALADIDIFYQLIMPGRDYWGAAYFVGTGCVFRREALESAGGFARQSITEDLLTSLHIQKRGWECRYHDEHLTTGLAPTDLKNYRQQKLRWCSGNIRDLLQRCPFWSSGLSGWQKMSFFSTLVGWLSGIPSLIYFVTPPLVILTGLFPISNYDHTLFFIHLVLLAALITGTKIAGRGYVRILDDVRYNMLNCFSLIQGTWRALVSPIRSFEVTSKDPGQKSPPQLLAPQIAVVAFSLIGGIWSLKILFFDGLDYKLGMAIASLWSWYHGILGLRVVWGQLRERFQRQHYRLQTELPIEFRKQAGDAWESGLVLDFNDSGLKLHCTTLPLAFGEWVQLRFTLMDRQLSCWGRIRHCDKETFSYGLSLHGLSQGERDSLLSYWFETAVPLFTHRYAIKVCALERWLDSPSLGASPKRSPRHRCQKPLSLYTEDGQHLLATIYDISTSGISLICSKRLPEGTQLKVGMKARGKMVYFPAESVRVTPLGNSGLFQYGLRYTVPYSSFYDELSLDLQGAKLYDPRGIS